MGLVEAKWEETNENQSPCDIHKSENTNQHCLVVNTTNALDHDKKEDNSHSYFTEANLNNSKSENLKSNISLEFQLSSKSPDLGSMKSDYSSTNKIDINVETNCTRNSEAHNSLLYNSDQSLFEESFELNQNFAKCAISTENIELPAPVADKNSSNNVNSSDSGLDFENGSFFENAFMTGFDLEPDISLKKNNSNPQVETDILKSQLSPDSRLIPISQFSINSFSTHTALSVSDSLTKVCKKRERSHEDDICKSSIIDGDELYIPETPTKRRKMQIQNTINMSALQDASVYYKSVDLTKLHIVDVCGDEKLYETLCSDLLEQKAISVSFACTKISENKPTIGRNILGNSKEIASSVREFVYKDRCVVGVTITWGDNIAYYISFENLKISNVVKIDMLKNLFSIKTLQVKIFDSKQQMKVAKLCCQLDFFCIVEDPKVADWMLEPDGREKNFQAMTVKYAPEAVSLSQYAGNCRGVGSIGLDLYSAIEPRLRAAIEAVITWHLCDSVCDSLAEHDVQLLQTYKVEMNNILCLTRMELNGIAVDTVQMQTLADNIKMHTSNIEKQAYILAGRRFSFTSSTDIAKVLGLYKGRKISTNKQTLEQQDNPIASLILQWRKLNCTLTKMIYPLIRLVEDDRIHGCCIIHNSTGRVSMHEPNLQNIPRDFEIKDSILNSSTMISCRSAFIPAVGCAFLSADYCQLELRLLAHLSQDILLIRIMKSNKDVFKSVAAAWKNIQEAEVNDVIRQQSKQICYGIIYGMGTKALSEQLSVTEGEAAEFMESFHNRYPGIKKYIRETISKCREMGYVETLASRKRYLPNINHQNQSIKSQAERQAVNTTVQGSAADIAKLATVLIEERFRNKFRHLKNLPKLVLQLHDELLYEVPKKYLLKTAKILKQTMEETVKLSVPFPVKLKSGSTWGTMTELILE